MVTYASLGLYLSSLLLYHLCPVFTFFSRRHSNVVNSLIYLLTLQPFLLINFFFVLASSRSALDCCLLIVHFGLFSPSGLTNRSGEELVSARAIDFL